MCDGYNKFVNVTKYKHVNRKLLSILIHEGIFLPDVTSCEKPVNFVSFLKLGNN